MAKQQPPGQHPVSYDQPLPGHYPVVTLQLNITRYASGKMGRMVLVVREPSLQVELMRSFHQVEKWPTVRQVTWQELESALDRLEYMQDADKSH